ncbi:MAG: 4Fe-4S binding protein, partial [Gammaproteobacteria bacterium]|nr:4Fe-4S binding protein [Gammaproteobacteria bacterium]
LTDVLPTDEALERIKDAVKRTYGSKGEITVRRNFAAVDAALHHLVEVPVPDTISGTITMPPTVSPAAPVFVRHVTARMMEGLGDELAVSELPDDGTYPSGTSQWEKRNISDQVPVWDEELCVQCGNCSFVCPHSVIRAKFFHESHLKQAPESFPSARINARGFPETRYALQVYEEDCTGCQLCVEACPVTDTEHYGRRAINMEPKSTAPEKVRENLAYFTHLPVNKRATVEYSRVQGAQFLQPLFEFSGACAGCGETPYIRLLSQLFGDRLLVANATGCSSIYGGNLPTTPWTVNQQGRGPAWSNSLFEDNAEFGLGMRVSVDKHTDMAHSLLRDLSSEIDSKLVNALITAPQVLESDLASQRERVAQLKVALLELQTPAAESLLSVIDHLVRRSVWLVGGDGWAYDIGSGGLDHVLASGRDVNVLVLDTEVYSNTGGQMSKATPTAASAKFAAAGKRVGKKDLALQAISYGNVYVAQIAMGANPQQSLLALREAEAYPGPSLVLAYSHCIAHGIDMTKGLEQQKLAVASSYWPLLRYNPVLREVGRNPFVLDSPRPTVKLEDYAYRELRYSILTRTHPEDAAELMRHAQEIVDLRWKNYEQLARYSAHEFQPAPDIYSNRNTPNGKQHEH